MWVCPKWAHPAHRYHRSRSAFIARTRTSGSLPQGFLLQPEFLDPEEEQKLIGYLQTLAFGDVRMRGVTAKRRVAQFGWRYSFETYKLTEAAPVPTELESVRNRAAAIAGVRSEDFSEALVTEYSPGAGIGWHRDSPQFDIVAGISLGGECRMRFQRGEGTDRVTAAAILAPRSLYLLTGEARSDWQHTIPSVDTLRWSITFRNLRKRNTVSSG